MRVRATKGDVIFEIELDMDSQMDAALSSLSRSLVTTSVSAPVQAASKPDTASGKATEKNRVDKKSPVARFQSGGTPHPKCVLLAMQALGRPATPGDVYKELLRNPDIDFRTEAARPTHGVKQILRNPKHYREIEDGVYVLNEL